MNSAQYEELCRRHVATVFGVQLAAVQTGRLPNPRRPGLPAYKHEIDLFWETGREAAQYLHIANAKWRAREKVDQPEVLLLQKVKEEVAAHKAVMLTSIGFTHGAVAAAKHHGIALHVVRPAEVVLAGLPSRGREAMQTKLEALASSSSRPIYTSEVVHRAWTPRRPPEGAVSVRPVGPRSPAFETRILTGYETKTIVPQTTRATPPIEKRAGPDVSKK
jgi:hypothetical protein